MLAATCSTPGEAEDQCAGAAAAEGDYRALAPQPAACEEAAAAAGGEGKVALDVKAAVGRAGRLLPGVQTAIGEGQFAELSGVLLELLGCEELPPLALHALGWLLNQLLSVGATGEQAGAD